MVEFDLYDLYLQGETLIVEHLEFRPSSDRECWVRREIHRVVGYEPEEWELLCVEPSDHSDLQPSPGDDDLECRLCREHEIHTRALHAKLIEPELTLEL